MITISISKLDVSSAEARAMAIEGLLSDVTSFDIYVLWVFLLYCVVYNFIDSMLAADITPQHVSIPGLILWKNAQAHNQNTK